MATHLMLDFETLGTTPDSAVLSLGAVLFNREQILEGIEWVFGLEEQLRAKSTVNHETLIWWMNQGEKAKSVFAKTQTEGVRMSNFLSEFQEWVAGKEVRVWGNGATFDVSLIENLLHRGQKKLPWKYSHVRCYRTLKACFGIEVGMKRQGVHHNALDDAKFQTDCLMAYFKQNPQADQ